MLPQQSVPGWMFPVQVKCESPAVKVLEKEKFYGLPSYVVYTVSLADPRVPSQGSLSTTLTVSSPMTDQSITIPVTVIYLTDKTTAPMRCKFSSALHMPAETFSFSDVYEVNSLGRLEKMLLLTQYCLLLINSADEATLFQQFVESYQVMIFTLFALLAGTAVMIIGKRRKDCPRIFFHSFLQCVTCKIKRNDCHVRLFWFVFQLSCSLPCIFLAK